MFKIVEDPGSSVLPSPASLPGAQDVPSRPIYRSRQPDITSGAGWPSMLFDGAQTPIFEPKVVIMSTNANIGFDGVSPDWPALIFNAIDDSLAAGFIISTRNGFPRWSIELGSHGPEPGGNLATNFLINRFDDTGTALFPRPFSIERATGVVTLGDGLTLGVPPENTLTIIPGAGPTDPVQITTSETAGLNFKSPVRITLPASYTTPAFEILTSATTASPLPPIYPFNDFMNVTPIHIVNNGNNANITIDTIGGVPFLNGRAAEGPYPGMPTANNRIILGLRAYGFSGGGYSITSRARMQFVAAEDYTDSSQGAFIRFSTAAIGSSPTLDAAERVRITDMGSVLIAETVDEIPTGGALLQITSGLDHQPSVHINSTGPGWPGIVGNSLLANTVGLLLAAKKNGLNRWHVEIANPDAEDLLGQNNGSVLDIRPWADDGVTELPSLLVLRRRMDGWFNGPFGIGDYNTHNTITLRPGNTTADQPTIETTGTVGIGMTIPVTFGTGANNKLTIAAGAMSNAITLTASGSGDVRVVGTFSTTGSVNWGATVSSVNNITSGGFVSANSGLVLGASAATNNQWSATPGASPSTAIVVAESGTGGVRFNSKIGFNAVPIAKPTGYTAPTGTAMRATFATGSVTLPVLAEHVKALIDDLTSYGLIGP